MGANGFKTPSRAMAATITLVLLALYSFSYLAPVLKFDWLQAKPEFDDGLKQTLLLMLTLAIGYYIGSSKSSADNADVLRAQIPAAPPPTPAPAQAPSAMVAPAGELGPFATLAALQAAVPAAVANAGKRAWVGAAIPFASYVSDGTTWNPDVASASPLVAAPAAAGAPAAPVSVNIENKEPLNVAVVSDVGNVPTSAAIAPATPRNPF